MKLKHENLNVRQHLKYSVDILNWLRNEGYNTKGKRNAVLMPFLKANGIRYEKLNSRYKGDFTADSRNAAQVGAHGLFKQFKQFVMEKRTI
ncbi:hypothetical protein PP178_04200 [Zeaxanthinibacter sp. PT1]|uniref:hypothetical protein n=1 Tax=Zeaxanthinibacter TaxID=561554 RepID=UPI00234BCC6B|nr:hypothetical protein [Zeaxanthinibacter sp. PT1]MDC6350743.1 hypothetical protein [Zeaxanthinibacter sp. PT1]